MPGISVGGLVSGLDTDAIVSQLMSLERQPRSRLELRQIAATARQDGLRDIASKLRALETAARDLKSPLLAGDTQTVTSLDPAKADVKRTGMAAAGSYAVEVTALAAAGQASFAWTPPAAETTQRIQGKDVTFAAGASLDDALKAINEADAGVVAQKLGDRLWLTSRATGAASTIAVGTGPAGGMDDVRTGADAVVRIGEPPAGGAADTRPERRAADGTFDDVALGLEVTARSLGRTSLQVSALAPDPAATEAKLKSFVDAYNLVIDAVRSRVGEKRVPNATSAIDSRKGALFADTTLNGILSKLRTTVSTTFASHPELGVATGASTGARSSTDALAGKLTFDAAKFRETLTKDPSATRGLVKDAGTAFGEVLQPLSTVGGLLDERIASSDRDLSRIKGSLARLDDRLERKEEGYRAQFTRLEKALAEAKSRESDLVARLGQND